MHRKKVSLVINPREGQNIAKITDILAVLAAAGWDTRLLLKKYYGETVSLGMKAAQEGADLVVSYGGDGTLSQVVNGVLKAKGKSIVGLLPGGTANEWAGEMHIPSDPVKAALALINSKMRDVDVGHVDVQGLIFPAHEEGQSSTPSATPGKKQRKKEKVSPKAKHDFLMMAGLGFDARVIGHTSNELKHKIGPLAFDIAAAKTLSKQHSFPVEIWDGGVGEQARLLWKGDALQIIVANTRTYANMVQIADDATLDDGDIDLCVITGGDPLSVIGQFTSIVLQHKPDDGNTHYFRSAHFSIHVPASVLLQLDGSVVKLNDYLRKSDQVALQNKELGRIIVKYRFDAFPRAVKMLVPSSYDDTLFRRHQPDDASQLAQIHETKSVFTESPKEGTTAHKKQIKPDVEKPRLEALLDNGRKVVVIGGTPNPAKKYCYILAGGEIKQATGESRPVAVLIDHKTAIMNTTGQHIAPSALEQLQEGASIVVTGKKSKRGVIHAEHVII